MDRRTRILFAALLIAIVAGTAIAALLLSDPSELDLPPGTESMTGVVVQVDGSGGLGNVNGFVLRQPGGELAEFSLRELRNGTQFPPGHLAEHQATAAPIRVWFRIDGDERLALRLEDAPT
ncbi:MAG: hypothetical protein ACJ77D_01620 [Chloroflexota bacterium]